MQQNTRNGSLALFIFLIANAGIQNAMAQSTRNEDPKTAGLKCYEVGYRYGHTATSSMNGKKFNPSWAFAIPDRCKNDPDTSRGIQAGTRAA